MKVAVAVAFAMAFGQAQALHSGGVAHCDACHTMHNSSANGGEWAAHGGNGSPLPPQMTTNALPVGTTNKYLLQGQDPSSTCLNCHAKTAPSSYGVLDANFAGTILPDTMNFTPGGDFSFVKNSEEFGHNIIAQNFGLVADTRRQAPPGAPTGNTWNGNDFSCVSCHDPHGQSRYTDAATLARPGATALAPISGSGSSSTTAAATAITTTATLGAYRILGGNGWAPRSSAGQPTLTVQPPIAVAPSTYNKSETTFAGPGKTGQTVVAYAQGMSEWCGSCHEKMHTNANSSGYGNNLRHPAGAGANMNLFAVANYNKYVKTGDWSGAADAYDAFIPFELGGDRDAVRQLARDTAGDTAIAAGTASRVMCLTCHRAHASGFASMMRWDYGNEFVAIPTAGVKATNPAGWAGYYGRGEGSFQYGPYQRSLCNKCHVKD